MNFKVEDNKIILTVPVKEIKKNAKKQIGMKRDEIHIFISEID